MGKKMQRLELFNEQELIEIKELAKQQILHEYVAIGKAQLGFPTVRQRKKAFDASRIRDPTKPIRFSQNGYLYALTGMSHWDKNKKQGVNGMTVFQAGQVINRLLNGETVTDCPCGQTHKAPLKALAKKTQWVKGVGLRQGH
jgi:hypothetical protein